MPRPSPPQPLRKPRALVRMPAKSSLPPRLLDSLNSVELARYKPRSKPLPKPR